MIYFENNLFCWQPKSEIRSQFFKFFIIIHFKLEHQTHHVDNPIHNLLKNYLIFFLHNLIVFICSLNFILKIIIQI